MMFEEDGLLTVECDCPMELDTLSNLTGDF